MQLGMAAMHWQLHTVHSHAMRTAIKAGVAICPCSPTQACLHASPSACLPAPLTLPWGKSAMRRFLVSTLSPMEASLQKGMAGKQQQQWVNQRTVRSLWEHLCCYPQAVAATPAQAGSCHSRPADSQDEGGPHL